ncbi:MAG: D-alanyl-D-alanine carboxypeptidase/D-alanyl-D-alanine-endopeptidase [Rhodoferax sp.]
MKRTLPFSLAPLLALAALACSAQAQTAQRLPASVLAALAQAQVPAEALGVVVAEAGAAQPALLAHRAQQAFNPASVMKLVTTAAALDLLGPGFSWRTPVVLDGPVREGVLHGNLVLQGQGDPKLVLERMWLLLRRVQGLGVHTIAGDIVLDHSAFAVAATDPADFDGEPLRPYNASPDALLLNYKALVMTFSPAPEGGVARVQYDPPLAGVQLPPTVALAKERSSPRNGGNGNGKPERGRQEPGECGDWRSALRADFSDPTRVRFAGAYPSGCGERVWPLAYADPASYGPRAMAGLWQAMGGTLQGAARWGERTGSAPTSFEAVSEPLGLVVRDINKYSNNVMAQQLFLTLAAASGASAVGKGNATAEGNEAPAPPAPGADRPPAASFERAQQVLLQWWRKQLPDTPAPVLDNGSGLSRAERITPAALAALLQRAWGAPWMPEYLASLPIAGVDGTLKRMKNGSGVSAHLKTGSLRDANALAGYVLGANGKRYVLVALVNHPNASATRPALQALVEWAAQTP